MIEVIVTKIKGKQIRLGFKAPPEVVISRGQRKPLPTYCRSCGDVVVDCPHVDIDDLDVEETLA